MVERLYRAGWAMLALFGLLSLITITFFKSAGYDFMLIHPTPTTHISAIHDHTHSDMPTGTEADQISGTFYEVISYRRDGER